MLSYLDKIWELTKAGDVQAIWFWFSFYAILACGWSAFYQIRIRKWPATEGQLENASVERFGVVDNTLSEQSYHLESSYKYNVSGIEYRGNRVSSWIVIASHNLRPLLKRQLKGIKLLPPNGVEVIYSPRRPEKSFLIRPGWVGIIITISIAILPAVLYFLKFHA